MTRTTSRSATSTAHGPDRGGSTSPAAGDDGGRGADRNLRVNSLMVTAAVGVTGVAGLLYWGAAGRLYPAAEVGKASAIVSSALAMATLSNLSFGTLFERFLPVSGRHTGRNITVGMVAGLVSALVFGLGYLVFAPSEKLFDSPLQAWAFPLWVMILAPANLVDQATVGLRVARWGATKNIVHSFLKLGAVAVLGFTGSSTVIVLSWMVPGLIVTSIVVAAVGRRAAALSREGAPSAVPPRREVARYFGSSLFVVVLSTVTPLLLPLIVVAELGPEQNAYFGVAWQLVSAFYLILFMLSGPFVSEATGSPAATGRLVTRFVVAVGSAAVAGAVGMAFVAPVLLSIIKPGYREATEPMLHFVGLALVFAAVEVCYNAVARLLRRLYLSMVVQVMTTGTILALSWYWVSDRGITGIGHAYLVGQLVAAAVLVVPLVVAVRHLRRTSAERYGRQAGGGVDAAPAPDAPAVP